MRTLFLSALMSFLLIAPAQAAMSIMTPALVQPTAWASTQWSPGIISLGVNVAYTTSPMSLGSTPAEAMARSAAMRARSDVRPPGPANRRWLMWVIWSTHALKSPERSAS